MSISKTFCPAKWDEINVNLNANYVYSCCESVPIKINRKEDINQALDQQRNNLLEGIQDPACNYCWKNENAGYESLRHRYLKSFDYSKIEDYKNNKTVIKQIEVNLGNECNFQCIYCNPKFSSQWETDIKEKPYKLYSDKFFYAIDETQSRGLNDTIKWLSEINQIERLEIIGGEPIQNKNFFKIINAIDADYLGFSTNLSCKTTKPIDKILALSTKYTSLSFKVSLDSTGKNAEFSRYGMDFDKMLKNIDYLLSNAPANVMISFTSLMTSITIRDFGNMVDLVDGFYKKNPNIVWNIVSCHDPNILTLDTLPDQYKPALLEQINNVKNKNYIQGLSILEGAINSSKFNKTLYNLMKHFLEEFSARKNIPIPVELE
jgi:MoaA/NifB/PqqE/SkfB family radical SAM enzyme